MKTLYLECNMGAAGDMLTAALLELHPDPQGFVERMNRLGLPGVVFAAQPAVKCGITGTQVSVTVGGEEEESHDVPLHSHGHSHVHETAQDEAHPGHAHDHVHVHDHEHTHDHEHEHTHGHEHSHEHGHGHHHHAGMGDIRHILSHLDIPQPVRQDAEAVYQLIAQAESHAHGRPVEEIHFHEVGTLDAVTDVVAVCWLLHDLAPEQIVASPVHVGCGQVRCAHGILPVPAPATAYILQGVPTYGGSVQGELCTPTGAALLKHFVQRFGPSPVMRVEKTGYGMGKKDFEAANCVRAMLGQTQEESTTIAQLACNLDDMTPEALGFAQERLWEAGALDVTTAPIGMKKNRPGVQLTCLCRLEDREKLVSVLFAHTTTLGVRESLCARYTLARSQRTVETEHGPVRVKEARGWGVTREKPEYEDVANIAREQGLTLDQVKELL